MLDSSPIPLPARIPLKRSASTASLASLPTPPRTHRKHTRGQSRGSCDSDSDDHALLSTDDETENTHKNKKRRTSQVVNDEDVFWLGGPASDTTSTEVVANDGSTKATTSNASKSHKAPLLYRRMQTRQQQHSEVVPVSPPPSHRRPAVAVVATPKPQSVSDTTVSPPTTPRTRSVTKREAGMLLRDSPENPFLATPQKAVVEDSTTPSPSVASANPSPRTPVRSQEKPTITYVFRGVRRAYANPLYNIAEGRPYSPPPASLLPVEDPDYSPPIHCTPKLLFPAARRHRRKKSSPKAHTRSPSSSDGELPSKKARGRSPSLSGDELDGADIKPTKLDFIKAANKSRNISTKEEKDKPKPQTQTLDQELKTEGESEEVFL